MSDLYWFAGSRLSDQDGGPGKWMGEQFAQGAIYAAETVT
jgi:hypothetical protein